MAVHSFTVVYEAAEEGGYYAQVPALDLTTEATALTHKVPLVTADAKLHAAPVPVKIFKNPECGCCDGYADYLRHHGFAVTSKPTNDLAAISQKAGVPPKYQGCHTMFIDSYVIDGHVPVEIVRKLLAERPAIAGITLPGMPLGSPGMGGSKEGPFTIYAITKDGAVPSVYATE